MRLNTRTTAAAIFALSFGSLASGVLADDWQHFRGNSRTGVASEPSGWTGDRWPLAVAWKANVGEGASSPTIFQGKLYVAGWASNQEQLSCLDAQTGKVLWRQSYSSPRYGRHSLGDKGIYSGICSTPEIDAGTKLAYTLGIDGALRCWDIADAGERRWGVNLYEAFDVPQRPKVGRSGHRDYGYTSSPLVMGDALIVEVGSPGHGCLIAFEKRTGKVLWKSACKRLAGHTAGPFPITVSGVPCVAVHHFDGLLVARSDPGHQGETIAEVPWRTDFANNIASVSVHGQDLLVTSHYNHQQMARFHITLAGAKEIWRVAQASKVCTPVIADGRVYWAWQQLWCLDWDTGKRLWSGGRFSDAGSCIYTSDKRLVVWGGRGDLTLVEGAGRSPDRYHELAKVSRLGASDAWPHVALADGWFYCKDRKGNLVALKQ